MAKDNWDEISSPYTPEAEDWDSISSPVRRRDVTAFKVSTGDQAARDQESLGILQRERENAQRLAAEAQTAGNQADVVRYSGDQAALDREIAARAKTAGVEVPVAAPAPVAAAPAKGTLTLPTRPGQSRNKQSEVDYVDATGTIHYKEELPEKQKKSSEYVPVVARVASDQKAPLLIERRGAPVSEERFRELQRAYDAATPEQRKTLVQRSGYEGSVFKNIDDQYRAMEKAAVDTPAARLLDTRREARRAKLAVESGMDVAAADALAAQQALQGQPTTRLAQAKASDFDFETKNEFARPSSQVDMRQKGGIIYRAKPSNADELAAAAKAIGGKVSGQFESAAAGAWQMVGDLVSATGELTGSNAVDQFGTRLSAGNAEQQKRAQARLAAIGDNPNAALNFVESGVSGAITNIAPLFVLGPTAGISAMVGQVVADEYGTGKAAGLSGPESLARGTALGAAELIGELASLPTPLVKGFKQLVKGVPTEQILPEFARYLLKENAAEQVTGALNFATDKWAPFGIKPDSTLADYIQAVGDTLYQTTAQTLVMGAAGKVAAPAVRAFNTPERQFANAFQADVDARQANAEATDYLARWELSANKDKFAGNVANMESAVQAYQDRAFVPLAEAMAASRAQEDQFRAQQDQADLQQAATAGDAASAADNLSGSLSEMLEPALTGEAIPGEVLPPEPAFTGVAMAEEALPVEPELLAPEAPAGINPDLEQKMGFDKLRLNAPRPRTIQGTPVASLSDDQLQTMAGDEAVAPISRRSAAIELTARQAEPGAFTQQAAPQTTGAPSTVSYAGETLDTSRTSFGLGDAQGRVSDAPVTGVGATARAELQARLDRAAAIHGVEVPTLAAPTPENEAAVNVIADALGGVGLVDKVVPYTDPNGADGFELGGVIAVNTDTQKGIAHSSFHESFHVAERIAAADTAAGRSDTPAQQYVASIHSLFDDMSDDGKRAYVSNFLNKDELDSIQDPVAREARITEMLSAPKTRSEMTADFMGNRATDKRFLASLAQADPEGFSGFVTKWVGILDGMISRLKGVRTRSNLESVKVDSYLKDLNRAKMVARDALVAYRNGTLQQLAPTTTPPAMSLRQGEENAPTSIVTGSENIPGAPAPSGRGVSEDGGGPAPVYGTARKGAISVVGRHYSTTPRQSLSGAYYGQGLKGAERDRLDRSTDPRLKNRIYFYVDQGAGIRPESGVGGYAHETRLDNIYDPQTRIIKPQADFNAFESAVINAGFDGYIAPFGNNQSAVVLLGQKHKAVPVKAIGQPRAAAPVENAAPSVLKKGLMSKELSQIDTSSIPGARVRAGNLEVPAEQRDAANAELERIGSEVRFSAKEEEAPPTDSKVYKDVADKIGLSAAEYNATALPLMTGGVKDKAFQAPVVGGIPEVVQWLDQRRAATGLPKLDINKPADRTTLAKLLASEAVAAIKSAGNAVEWYDETVAKTLRVMAVKYPELNTDQNARNAFLMATAISSQTLNVEDNLKYASAQYEAYRASVNAQGVGKFPEVGTGKSAPAMANNFALANDVLAKMGPDLLRRFLQTEFTKRELETMGYSIGGESMDEKLLGSAIFGPKIGFGFYSNLSGNFEPVTMDMWFMRTVGRLAGTLPAFDAELFPKQVAKLRAAIAEKGPANVGVYADQFDPAVVQAAMESDEGAIALARQVHSLHNRQFIKERAAFDSGTRIKTPLVGASDTIIKSADKPTDAPGSGGERQRLRDVVRQMVDMVQEQTGKRVPPAALQALIWYPEQELYKKLGVRLRVTSQDYAGAAESLLKKEGFNERRLRAAAKPGPGPARQVAGQQVAGTNQPTGGTNGPSGPIQGAERETFVHANTPLETIFEGLNKRGLAKTRAEAAIESRPDGAQIKYVHENFLDILSELDDSGLVEINCK